MLKHEQTDPSTVSPTLPLPVPNAAEARVTPDELNAALKALEDRQSSTVAIGSVVEELRLNATPEEIWAQVQKQRVQKAAEEQARQIPIIAPPAAVFQVPPHPRRRRRWAAIGVALIVLGVGIAHSGFVQTPPSVAPISDSTIVISGEDQTETIPAQGKDVVIGGEDNNITLTGKARSVTISGQDNKVQGDAPKAFVSEGEDNSAKWNNAP